MERIYNSIALLCPKIYSKHLVWLKNKHDSKQMGSYKLFPLNMRFTLWSDLIIIPNIIIVIIEKARSIGSILLPFSNYLSSAFILTQLHICSNNAIDSSILRLNLSLLNCVCRLIIITIITTKERRDELDAFLSKTR